MDFDLVTRDGAVRAAEDTAVSQSLFPLMPVLNLSLHLRAIAIHTST